MATFKGADVILSVKNQGSSSYIPIGCLTSNGIEESREVNEGTVTKCNNGQAEPVPGRYSYTINFEGVAIDNETSQASWVRIRQIIREGEKIDWKEATKFENGDTADQIGKGYITSFSTSAPADGEVTFSGTITGVGHIGTTGAWVEL